MYALKQVQSSCVDAHGRIIRRVLRLVADWHSAVSRTQGQRHRTLQGQHKAGQRDRIRNGHGLSR